MYRTQDTLPFEDEYFEPSMDQTFLIRQKAETEEAKECLRQIKESDEDDHIRHVFYARNRNLVHGIYSISKGFLGYIKNNEENEQHINEYACEWYQKIRIKRALTAIVNENTLVIRIFQYATHAANHDPHGYKEVFRFCLCGNELWAENRREIKAIDPRYGRILKDKSSPLLVDGTSNYFKVYPFAVNEFYISDVNDLLRDFAWHVHGTRIYKYVPDVISEDLQKGQLEIIPAHSKQPEFMEYTEKFSTMESFATKGLVFHGFYGYKRPLKELERVYYLDGKCYSFVYNEILHRFVSKNGYLRIMGMPIDNIVKNTIDINAEHGSETMVRNRLKASVKNTGLPEEILQSSRLKLGTLRNVRFRIVEHAIKEGLDELANCFICGKEDETYREINLTKVYSMPMKYIRQIDDMRALTYRGRYERFSIKDVDQKFQYLKTLFPDPKLRVKVIKNTGYSIRWIKWLEEYYESDLAKIRVIINAMLKSLEKTSAQYDGMWCSYGLNTAIGEYMDYAENRELVNAYLEEERFPKYLKAGQIRKMHDRVMKYVRRAEEKEGSKIFEKGLQRAIAKETYKRRFANTDKFIVTGPKNIDDLYDEGNHNENCVGSYGRPMAQGKTSIYFLRKAEAPEETYYTIEVRGRSICQCFGMRNSIDRDKSRKKFVEQWAEDNHLLIACGY